MFKILKL